MIGIPLSVLPFYGNAELIANIKSKNDEAFIITNVTCANKGTETYYFHNEQ